MGTLLRSDHRCRVARRRRPRRTAGAALLLAAVAALAVPGGGSSLHAQGVTWSGQVRPRWEAREPAPGDAGASAFTSMRTRVSAAVDLTPASVFVQLQDVRTWGEETHTLGDARADALDLHQAYVNVGLLEAGSGGGLALRAGRQEASYGGQRLLGAVDWAQQGRAFDGVRGRFEAGVLTADVFAFQLAEAAVPGRGADATLLGTWEVVQLGEARALDLYALWLRDGEAEQTDEVTAGVRLAASGGVQWRLEGAVQRGRRVGRDVSAWFAGVRVGRAFAAGRATATLWADVLSGGAPGDERVGAFSTLFATNHKFYGHADLFTDLPLHTGGRGLQDLAVKATLVPAVPWTLGIDVHAFRAVESSGLSSGRFGEEVDLTLARPLGGGVRVTAGLGLVWASPALEELDRLDRDLAWGFLMLDAAF